MSRKISQRTNLSACARPRGLHFGQPVEGDGKEVQEGSGRRSGGERAERSGWCFWTACWRGRGDEAQGSYETQQTPRKDPSSVNLPNGKHKLTFVTVGIPGRCDHTIAMTSMSITSVQGRGEG
eukprot:632607-Rhodomonas_salina.1